MGFSGTSGSVRVRAAPTAASFLDDALVARRARVMGVEIRVTVIKRSDCPPANAPFCYISCSGVAT
jgi:hypothetical protein